MWGAAKIPCNWTRLVHRVFSVSSGSKLWTKFRGTGEVKNRLQSGCHQEDQILTLHWGTVGHPPVEEGILAFFGGCHPHAQLGCFFNKCRIFTSCALLKKRQTRLTHKEYNTNFPIKGENFRDFFYQYKGQTYIAVLCSEPHSKIRLTIK